MANDHNIHPEEKPMPMASEPAMKYGTCNRTLRRISPEEIADCMTLEESERLITEKIYKFFHPDA